MSLNRRNVIWQSADGSWNRGFYEFWNTDEDSDDFDPEWDVEYGDDFNWVSTGHATKETADSSWRGANPGCDEEIEFNQRNAAGCAALDAKVAAFRLANPGKICR